ncbi:MAG: class I SAM-dependent methyltransferase [Gammaproteobacteria bacterium]|nr:class I SAM-dependent methyltransferase [Gammaproteobacteria bacterium]
MSRTPRTVIVDDTDNLASEKRRRVSEVFSQIAHRYDLMNDVMSLGTHRILKRVFCDSVGLRPGHKVLDVAGGTGDIARLLAPVVGPEGEVTVLDINESMVREGRNRLIDRGLAEVKFVIADAEQIPMDDQSFDAITVAFGIRNVSNKDKALRECHRVLKPNGRLAILEFSKPQSRRLDALFSVFRRTWPIAGHFVVGATEPYKYLVESIDQHPNQQAMLHLLEAAGFKGLKFENLLGGIAAIHQGLR